MTDEHADAFEEFSKKLMIMGFKEYEARVYLALLTLGHAIAREVHELSKVPRPRVYDVLKELSAKGIIEIHESSPTVYRAIPLRKVAEDFEQQIHSTIRELLGFIQDFSSRSFSMPTYTTTLIGERSVFRRLREIVVSTERTLYVGMPKFDPQIIKQMLPIFEIAHNKGVKMIFLIMNIENDFIKKLKKLGEVKKVKSEMQKDELTQIITDYFFEVKRRDQKILFAVNKDKSEMLFVTEHAGRTFGVWIGLKVIAELQGKLMEKITGY